MRHLMNHLDIVGIAVLLIAVICIQIADTPYPITFNDEEKNDLDKEP